MSGWIRGLLWLSAVSLLIVLLLLLSLDRIITFGLRNNDYPESNNDDTR